MVLGLTLLASLTFAVSLAVTMPAAALARLVNVPPQVETLSGTLRAGRAVLAGGHSLDWRLDAGQLLRGRLAIDAALTGPDTQLSGRLLASPFRVSAEDWSGLAGPGLLALFPRVIVTCDSAATIDPTRLTATRTSFAASGIIGIGAGTCTYPSGRTIEVPPMTATLATAQDDATVRVTHSDGAGLLASATLAGDRHLLVRIEPAGAQLVPGLPASAPTILEIPF